MTCPQRLGLGVTTRLEDADQVQSYINGRLALFVQNKCEASIVSGAGTNDLLGLTSAGKSNKVASAGPNNADGIFKAMNGQRCSALMEPDWILMHPDNWQTVRLLRDSTGGTLGAYLGGGPFFGAYGQAGAQASSGNQVEGANDYLWGKPLYVTTAVGSGTAIIGTRAGAQVFSRGGLSVEASNAGYVNSLDLFTSNQVAIRAERRLALCVYRPYAFTVVSSLT
jgi:Phage capsid family